MKAPLKYSAFGLGLLALGICVGWHLAGPRNSPINAPAEPPAPEGPVAQESSTGLVPLEQLEAHPAASVVPTENRVTGLLGEIEALDDPQLQEEALERAAASVKRVELRHTLDQLASAGGATARQLRECLVRRWAQMDPKGASQWAAGLRSPVLFNEAVPQVAVSWAEVDFPSAWSWVGSLAESETKQNAQLAAAYEESRFEPERALQAASTLPPTTGRDNLLAFAASQWANVDATAALSWARQAQDPDLRDALSANILTALANQDPATAASLAATNLRPGETQDRVAVAVVQRWAQSTPQEAAHWLSQFPDSPLRQACLQALLSIWGSQDSANAANWVTTLPNGSLRDNARLAYAQTLAANPGVPSSLGSP